MPASSAPPRRQPDWSERGSAAVDLGDLDAARHVLRRGRAGGPRQRQAPLSPGRRGGGSGRLGAAAASLTEALRLDPAMADAARRLALLAARRDLPGDAPLNAAGLKAALAHDTVDRELIAEMAMRHLAGAGPLAGRCARAGPRVGLPPRAASAATGRRPCSGRSPHRGAAHRRLPQPGDRAPADGTAPGSPDGDRHCSGSRIGRCSTSPWRWRSSARSTSTSGR